MTLPNSGSDLGDPNNAVRTDPITVALPSRYELGTVIGRTIDSVRTRAVDRETGESVIIKSAGKPSVIQKEAGVLAAVCHSSVIRLKHWDTVAGGAYLVTEDAGGDPIEDWLADDASRSTEQIAAVLTEIAGALQAFHAAGFIHRGIRPEPIWITPAGQPILMSADRAAEINLPLGFQRPQVRHGVFCPPEQLEDTEDEGPWSDVYALSGLAYWALSGEKPPSVNARLNGEPLAAINAVEVRLSAAAAAAVTGGLELNPMARPSSIAAWLEAFEGVTPTAARRPVAASILKEDAGEDAKIDLGPLPVATMTDPKPPETAADVVTPSASAPPAADSGASKGAEFVSDPRPAVASGRVEGNGGGAQPTEMPSPANALPPLASETAAVLHAPHELLSEASPDKRTETPRPSGFTFGGRLFGLSLALFLCGAALAWFGYPLYEREFKHQWHVNAAGGGDALSIGDAMLRAGDGATIRVAPGTYPETLVIDRPLHLYAADPEDKPVVTPQRGPCVIASAPMATISGFTLRVAADQKDAACIVVSGGRPIMENNRIIGGAGAAILIRDGADPVVRGNEIVDTQGPGLVIATGGAGSIENNTFNGVSGASILVRSGGAPGIAENTISGSGGVIFAEGAKGWLRNNLLTSPRGTGIQILSGAAPQVLENTIENAAEAGIFVYDYGRGLLQRNTISASGLSGIVIASGAAPRVTGNDISASGEHGILVVGTFGAKIADNTIRNSRGHAIAIAADADADIGDNVMTSNKEPQVLDDRRR